MRPRPAPRVPDPTVVVARAAFPKGSPAMSARDELADVFDDEQFAAAFGMRGAPAESPGALALVTVLQYVENLTGPPRKFRTSVMGLSYAANCSFRNSLWTSLGVR